MVKCKSKDCKETTNHLGGYCYSCYLKIKETKKGEEKNKYSAIEYKPSEGELFIEDFLKNYDIKYKTQVKIDSLKGDTASYRVADFYLPNYKIYIEFFGQWNTTTENKEKYKIKKDLYSKNKIPCLYLYPENLGILPFVFDKRIQEVLRNIGNKKQLRKYRLFKFADGDGGKRIFFIVFFLIILSIIRVQIVEAFPWYFIVTLAIIYQLYLLIIVYRKIFLKNNYPFSRLD